MKLELNENLAVETQFFEAAKKHNNLVFELSLKDFLKVESIFRDRFHYNSRSRTGASAYAGPFWVSFELGE